ncbi:MAG TPA: NADPH-dependent FMN reductase [Holophagaceae bacterium]|nr:NADPH-dependent FMN reductase [Holophagaceae bacterium]
MTLRILALSGSLRSASSNSALLRAGAALAPEGVTFDFYEGLGTLPPFDPGLDLDPTDYRAPGPVVDLRDRIAAADAVLICTPEYAFGMPGVLKNALDWIVGMGVIEAKPVAAWAASPMGTGPFGVGGSRAHQGLVWVLTALGTRYVKEAELILPLIRTKMDGAGNVTDPETIQALQAGVVALTQAAEARLSEGAP